MWDLPRPGLEPVSPALAGRLSTTAPPGKPYRQFLQSIQGTDHSNLMQIVPENKKRTCPNSFYEVRKSLMPKSNKNEMRKKYHRPISLISIDIKIQNKILQTVSSKVFKATIHHTLVRFTSRIQKWLNINMY